MAKKGEVLWEVGKQLTKEDWTRGEFVRSEMYQIPEIGPLQIYFYPAGVDDEDKPIFAFIRTNTRLVRMRIKGELQLYHRDTLAASFVLDHVFQSGLTEFRHHFTRYLTLHRLKIFHSLPDLCYLWRNIEIEPDPNDIVHEPEPQPPKETEPEMALEALPSEEPDGVLESVERSINYVLSYFWQ